MNNINKVINVIIIDDEEEFLMIFSKMIKSYFPEINIIGTATNINDALLLIKNTTPDIIFIDIILGKENGFELIDKISNLTSKIVFVTAHDEWAIKAIKYSAFDYILKPVKISDLKELIDKWKKTEILINDNFKQIITLLKENFNIQNKIKKIAINTQEEIRIINLEEIVRCESDGAYTKIFLKNKEVVTCTKNIAEIEKLLPSEFFIRCSKSNIVNLNYVKKFNKLTNKFELVNNEKIDVSVRKKFFIINFLKKIINKH